MKFLETKFKMIELMVENRKLTDEEKRTLKIDEILLKNQKLNKEDFELNNNEVSNVELVKLLEENYEKKEEIFTTKKEFMVYIGNMKE